MRAWQRPLFWIVLGGLVYLALYPVVFANKQISHDDIALFVAVRDFDVRYWFTKGYSEFFDLSQYAFIRPVSNLLMFLGQTLFGPRYGLYFIPLFLCIGAGAWAGVRLAGALGLPDRAALLLGAGLFLMPAWFPPTMTHITFQTDATAGVLTTLAALACLRQRWWLAALALLVALFTKEIALFAPIAAALWAGLWLRNGRAALLLLAPLLIWFLVRLSVFGPLDSGVYITSGGSGSLLTGVMRGLAIWPTGFATTGAIKGLVQSLRILGPAGLLQSPFIAASLVCNLLLYLMVAVAALAGLRHLLRPAAPAPVAEAEGLVLIWTLGALGFLVLVGYDIRFGAALHPMLLLLVARMAWQPPVWPALLRPLALLTLALFVAGLATLSYTRITGLNREPEAFAALTRAVEAVPATPDERILLFNGPITSPAPHWFMALWQRPGRLDMPNRILGCIKSPGAPPPVITPLPDGQVEVALTVPACARIVVLWTMDRAGVAEQGARLDYGPGAGVDLAFPDARVDRSAAAGQNPDADFGRRLVARFDPAAFSRVLALDWETGQYRALTLEVPQ